MPPLLRFWSLNRPDTNCEADRCLLRLVRANGCSLPDQGTALTFVHHHFGWRLCRFQLGVRFLDLRSVVFQLGCERFYLLLLLRDSCLQILNCAIKHGLL